MDLAENMLPVIEVDDVMLNKMRAAKSIRPKLKRQKVPKWRFLSLRCGSFGDVTLAKAQHFQRRFAVDVHELRRIEQTFAKSQ